MRRDQPAQIIWRCIGSTDEVERQFVKALSEAEEAKDPRAPREFDLSIDGAAPLWFQHCYEEVAGFVGAMIRPRTAWGEVDVTLTLYHRPHDEGPCPMGDACPDASRYGLVHKKPETVFVYLGAKAAAAAAGEKKTMGLWRKNGIAGGKYLVTRRDGSVPEWPNIVLGARDPAAPAGLRAYADAAERLGFNPEYVADVRALADEFERYRQEHGAGDPDAVPHRKDDEATVAKMRHGYNV